MLDLNKNFVDEVYDENGHVVDYTLKCPENFNFAYDVVDAIAAAEPDKRALLWCNPENIHLWLPEILQRQDCKYAARKGHQEG